MRKFNLGKREGYIAKDGRSDYRIVIKADADCSIEYAVEELKRLIKLATQAEIRVEERAEKSIGMHTVFLNCGELQKSEGPRNGFTIKTVENDVYIDGYDKTGLLFGVYRFMEITAGYMYLAQDETLIGNEVAFMQIDVLDYPDVENRDVYNYDTRLNADHARRLYLTGGNYSIAEPKYGEGSWWSKLWDQSLCDQLLDYHVYQNKYPKWYYQDKTRAGSPGMQLCYTEGLYSKDEYDKGDFSEKDYGDGRHGLFWTLVYNLITKYIAVETDKKLFQLGMNDNERFCDCPRCTEEKKKYGQSGVCVRFVNAVADEVEKWRKENCPEREIYLTVFAYYSTFEPPVTEKDGEIVPLDESVIVRDNVFVRWTPMNAYYMFPFMDEKHNPKIKSSLEGWAKVAKNFASWDYRIDFWSYISPFPQWMAAAENMRTYKKYGFRDVLYQGCSTTTGTPFVALDNYVRSRFTWDMTQDYEAITEYFIDNYYMEGGAAIKEYRKYLTEHYKRINIEQDYKAHSHCGVTRRYNFSFETIDDIEKIFAKGYASIAQIESQEPIRYAKLKQRLDSESLFYRFMKVAFYPEHYTNDERIDEIGNFEIMAKAAKLNQVCNAQDYTYNVIHVLRMPLEDRKGQIKYN